MNKVHKVNKMEKLKQEKTILNIIKYGPIILVLTLSFIITQVMLKDKKNNFEHELQNYQETYMLQNKTRIQEEINEVFNYVLSEKSKAEKRLKESIKTKVYDAHKIATAVYNQDSNKDEHNHSQEHILKSIKNSLGAMTYNKGRGYIFMDNHKGIKLLQPFNKELEGKNLLEFEDAKGYKFVKNIVKTIKNKTESYDSYYWYKSGDKSKAFKKISFYKYFEPFNVAIGTGEYIEDFENELKEKVLDRIQNIRYGNNGYIFIYDKKGTCLSHFNKDLIGTNRFNYQDKKGKYLVQDIINLGVEQKSGFITYNASVKPTKNMLSYSKISFIKLFEEWDWIIGTGFYTDSLIQEIEKKKKLLEASNQESIEYIIWVSIIITILFILLSFVISKFIELRFIDYKTNLEQELQKSLEKEKLLLQQSKMASMGEMIDNIAHQWKQPLSGISISASGIEVEQSFNMLTDEKLALALKNINKSVEYMSETIDDFRNFYSTNKSIEEFDLEDIVTKTLSLGKAKYKIIEIVTTIEPLKVTGIANELVQVLINILNNASDALNEKKVKDKILMINIFKKDTRIIIEIQDNAGGIPPDVINQIFDARFTTKSEDKGTGIGLYMSKNIIHNSFNGDIEVKNSSFEYKNNKYKGALFTIII